MSLIGKQKPQRKKRNLRSSTQDTKAFWKRNVDKNRKIGSSIVCHILIYLNS